jgi:hypothetical protein
MKTTLKKKKENFCNKGFMHQGKTSNMVQNTVAQKLLAIQILAPDQC